MIVVGFLLYVISTPFSQALLAFIAEHEQLFTPVEWVFLVRNLVEDLGNKLKLFLTSNSILL